MSAASGTTTLSTKGQGMLPKAVRDQLEWEAGTLLVVEPTAFAGLPGVVVEGAGLVAKATDWAGAGMAFADVLPLAAAGECDGFFGV